MPEPVTEQALNSKPATRTTGAMRQKRLANAIDELAASPRSV